MLIAIKEVRYCISVRMSVVFYWCNNYTHKDSISTRKPTGHTEYSHYIAQWETQGGQGVVQSAHAQNELIDKIIKVMIDLIVKTKCKKL